MKARRFLQVLLYGNGLDDLGTVDLRQTGTDVLVKEDPGFIVKHAGPLDERAMEMIREQRIQQLLEQAGR